MQHLIDCPTYVRYVRSHVHLRILELECLRTTEQTDATSNILPSSLPPTTTRHTPHTWLHSSVNFHFSCFRSCIASWRESSVFPSTWTFYRCGQPQKPANEHAIIIIIIIGDNIFISLHVAMCRFCHMWCVLLVLLQFRNGHQMTWNK